MCGIAGWYRRRGAVVFPADIEKQCAAIVHRGPDDNGTWVDADFGMGMQRLSIIDVAGGHQPIRSPDGRYVIVFNGEIYNHLELRPELEAGGYRFQTNSDTETILAGYLRWGDDVWIKLEGMYTVAIWDKDSRILTLARDPIGIKPLFFTEQQGGIAFGSELKSLTVLTELDFDIDDRAVHDFFRFGHIQPPRSIYRQVRQVPAGHYMHIGPSGEATPRQFWKPRLAIRHDLSEEDWIKETRSRLLETVRKHMLSDVPIGSFLSGGVDSSAITAAMARQTSQPITAFTIGFPGNAIDETQSAREIASHIGCNHVVLPVDLGEARDVVPEIVKIMDEPLGASAVIPCWYASKLAASHVKVVLCGEGGDELFVGYKRQRNAQRMARLQPLVRAFGSLAALVEALPTTSSRKWNDIRQQAGRVRDTGQLRTGFQWFLSGTEIARLPLRKTIFQPDFLGRAESSLEMLEAEYFDDPEWKTGDMIEQFAIGDLTVHMPGALLPRLDRTSMAHSLEARVPFLTHQFVDWALTMPAAMKTKGSGKYALREAIRDWLPDGILDRPKQGFHMPVADWFRGDFADFGRQAWQDSGAAQAGYLDNAQVDRLFTEHRKGDANHGKILYALTIFGSWWQQHSKN